MTTTATPATTAATDLATVTERRADIWRTIADAVVAGCPVPLTVYLAESAGLASVRVTKATDVAAWTAHLGLPKPTVHVYPVDHDTAVQRCTQSEARRGRALVEVV